MIREYPETRTQPELRVTVAEKVSLRVLAWHPKGTPAPGDDRASILLLHGLASTAETWEPVAQRLAEAGHDVYAPDFRGHGLSDKPDDGYDLATYVTDALKLVEGLGLERPVLVGHSLGAFVILEAFARNPALGLLVRGVVLVEGALVGASIQFASRDECLTRTALPPVTGTPGPRLEAYLRHSHPDWSEQRIRDTMAGLEVLPDGTVEWWLTPTRREALAGSMWEQHSAALQQAVDVPALWVVADTGEADWTEAKRAALTTIAGMPSARVTWLVADHDVHAHRPDELAAAINEWLGDGVGGILPKC
jgi:pimeloyl-ACP methyl ester carboxylesterase